MVPGRLAPVTSTCVPSGSDFAEQPFVSVLLPVPEQCAACPMYVFVPSLNTKFAVHWAPLVNVWTPGWMVALSAGAQARAPPAVANSATRATASVAARLRGVMPGVLPSPACPYAPALPGGPGELVALGLDVVEQLLEGVGELLDALALERVDHVVVADARLAELLEEAVRAVDVVLEGAVRLAVVLEGLDRLGRHRVDGLGADQLLDVHRVAVALVLDRGRRPQAALRLGALGLQGLEAVAGEDLLVGLVGEAGVGDGELAAQLVVSAQLVQALVGLGVDARDEERRDAGHARQLAPRFGEALEALDVGLGDRPVAVKAEDQRDVDRDAGGDRLLDGAQAGLGRGDLDVDVGPADQLAQAARLGDRLGLVVGEVRVDLDRHEPVDAAGALVRVAQQVAGLLDVLDGQGDERLLAVLGLLEDLAQLLVVGVALGDRLLEDRGVRRHAHDRVLAHQALELTLAEEGARQEVDPDALALRGELMEGRVGHWGSS